MEQQGQDTEVPEHILTALEDTTAELVELQELMIAIALNAENISDLNDLRSLKLPN